MNGRGSGLNDQPSDRVIRQTAVSKMATVKEISVQVVVQKSFALRTSIGVEVEKPREAEGVTVIITMNVSALILEFLDVNTIILTLYFRGTTRSKIVPRGLRHQSPRRFDVVNVKERVMRPI